MPTSQVLTNKVFITMLSRVPRNWATGAAESCITDVMTDGSKSGRMAALLE